MIDFARAILELGDIAYAHHGRTSSGMDCVGFILAVYARAGLNIDPCDIAYGRGAFARQWPLILERAARSFGPVHDFHDGDLLVVRMGRFPSHLGLVIGDRFYHMDAVKGRLTYMLLDRIRPYIVAHLRHHQLCEVR